MVTFPCLQVPYHLCNYFPLGLVGEDLAAAGLGWFIPGWAFALFVPVLRAQRCLEAGWNLHSGSPAFSPGINSSHSSCIEKWYYLGGSLGHSNKSARDLWWFNRAVYTINILCSGAQPSGDDGNLSSWLPLTNSKMELQLQRHLAMEKHQHQEPGLPLGCWREQIVALGGRWLLAALAVNFSFMSCNRTQWLWAPGYVLTLEDALLSSLGILHSVLCTKTAPLHQGCEEDSLE